jgi:hypothetical protein
LRSRDPAPNIDEERKGDLPASAKVTIAVSEFPSNRTVGGTQLRDAEALDLYLRAINHNLAELAQQCLLLRSALNAEQERLAKLQVVDGHVDDNKD